MTRVTRHVILALVVGVAVAIVFLVMGYPVLASSVGWDAAAVVFLITTWVHLWPMDADQTQSTVATEAPSSLITETIVILAAVLSLGTVVLLLFNMGNTNVHPVVRTVDAIVTVALAWVVVHTVFSLRYAREYYASAKPPIDFNTDDPPCYADFAYVSFGVGMAFQIADTNVRTTSLRRSVLKHALLSYVFATLILAVTVNLIASVTF